MSVGGTSDIPSILIVLLKHDIGVIVNYSSSEPYYHNSFIPADLVSEGWTSYLEGKNDAKKDKQFYLSKIFSFDKFSEVKRFVTMIDRLEVEYRTYNTVIVDKEDNSVTVRLMSPKYLVPSIHEIYFARMLTVRYHSQQQNDIEERKRDKD